MNLPPIKFLRKFFSFPQPLHLPGRCSAHPRPPSGDPPLAAAKMGRFGWAGAGGCRGSGRLPLQLGGLRLATTRAGKLGGGGRRGRGRRRREEIRAGSGLRSQAARGAGERGETGGGISPWSRSRRTSGARRRRRRGLGRRARVSGAGREPAGGFPAGGNQQGQPRRQLRGTEPRRERPRRPLASPPRVEAREQSPTLPGTGKGEPRRGPQPTRSGGGGTAALCGRSAHGPKRPPRGALAAVFVVPSGPGEGPGGSKTPRPKPRVAELLGSASRSSSTSASSTGQGPRRLHPSWLPLRFGQSRAAGAATAATHTHTHTHPHTDTLTRTPAFSPAPSPAP